MCLLAKQEVGRVCDRQKEKRGRHSNKEGRDGQKVIEESRKTEKNILLNKEAHILIISVVPKSDREN